MPLNDREYRYWITQNCPRQNCWIVMARLGEMISHEDTKVYGPDGDIQPLQLSHEDLQYVYFAHFDKNHVTTLVQDSKGYYLIDNVQITEDTATPEPGPAAAEEGAETKVIGYRSTIRCDTNICKLLEYVTGARKKAIGLKSRDKAKLSAKQVNALKGITYIDFINAAPERRAQLWRDYIAQNGGSERLDLSGFLTLTDADIESVGAPITAVREIVLYQNCRICNFTWMRQFPNLRLLSIWFNNNLQNNDIAGLAAAVPLLEVLELHSCMSLDGRILIPLGGMRMLNKLIINNTACAWQQLSYETVIKDEEWAAITNDTLQVLLIDSYNLTLDVISFILRSFRSLQNFIMCPQMLEKLQKSSSPGYLDETVMFHSAENVDTCFSRKRDVRVYDLVRSKCGNKFSESMLRKIRELDPGKAEAVENLENSRLKTYI